MCRLDKTMAAAIDVKGASKGAAIGGLGAGVIGVAMYFAGQAAGATYATKLSQTEDLLGVFELTDTRLLLRGVVSPEAGIYRTELVYEEMSFDIKLPSGLFTLTNLRQER